LGWGIFYFKRHKRPYKMEDKKEIDYTLNGIEFILGYDLTEYKTNGGVKYFPSVSYLIFNEVDFKPILDRDLIDEVRVFLFKKHNNIMV
jgi:hypothetical protein